jgi:hypothetical protein
MGACLQESYRHAMPSLSHMQCLFACLFLPRVRRPNGDLVGKYEVISFPALLAQSEELTQVSST